MPPLRRRRAALALTALALLSAAAAVSVLMPAAMSGLPAGGGGVHEQELRALAQAEQHFRSARLSWKDGRTEAAFLETDLGFEALARIAPGAPTEQRRARDELRVQLSRLVVTMSAALAPPLRGKGEIPLEMNDHVRHELTRFQTVERQFFIRAYRRSGRYMDGILQGLASKHMPEELAWLPLIESGFQLRALSPAAALGLWQFIPVTATRFGLDRDPWIDERMEPEMATAAALAYLKQLHSLFGDWNTALAAYNCGEGAVGRVLSRQPNQALDSFWDVYPRLPRETARYVPRFLATLHIVKAPHEHGFHDLGQPDAPLETELVEVNKSIALNAIAEALDLPARELQDLNPHMKRGETPPRPSQLRVPTGHGLILQARLETLASTPVPAILAAAARQPPPRAVPGTKQPAARAVPERKPPAAAAKRRSYRVRKGDTLSKIARRQGISVQALQRENRMGSRTKLLPGQTLSVPRSG
jgi:membrane-bound lytic murein transglycosylase D